LLPLPCLWPKQTTMPGSPCLAPPRDGTPDNDHCRQDFGNVKVSQHHHRLMKNG
jgi:hypothetical protein